MPATNHETNDKSKMTIRFPEAYRERIEALRLALGAKSGPEALRLVLDTPVQAIAEAVRSCTAAGSTTSVDNASQV